MLILYFTKLEDAVLRSKVAGESRSRFTRWNCSAFNCARGDRAEGTNRTTKIRSSLPSLHKRSACKELATLEVPKVVFWVWSYAELERNGLLSAFSTLTSNDYLIEAGPETLFKMLDGLFMLLTLSTIMAIAWVRFHR